MSIVAIETRVAIVAKEDCRARKLASMAIFSRMTWISLLQKKKGEEKGSGGRTGREEDEGEKREKDEGKRTKEKGEKEGRDEDQINKMRSEREGGGREGGSKRRRRRG